MLKRVMFGGVLLLSPAAAGAQIAPSPIIGTGKTVTTTTTTTTTSTTAAPGPASGAGPAAASGAAAGSAEPPKTYDWTLSVSPQWSSEQPFIYDEVTDSTALSLIASAKPPIGTGLALSISAGPSIKLDSDNDDSSGSDWSVSGELSTQPSRGFSFYGSHGFKAKFTRIFEDRTGHENISAAGARWKFADMGRRCAGTPVGTCSGMDLTLDSFYDWSNASDDLLDNEALNITARLVLPLDNKVKLNFMGIHARGSLMSRIQSPARGRRTGNMA